MKITAEDIVKAINQLPKDRVYHYVNAGTHGVIEIVRVDLPEGPIIIKRYDPSKGGTSKTAKEASISTQMIWRIANSMLPGQPVNFERILGASYNTRSVLETLIAHTPQFYFSYPGRVENMGGASKVRDGHKHLIWRPDRPHELANMEEIDTNLVISEGSPFDIAYNEVVFPSEVSRAGLDIGMQRRHAQIQIALIFIGQNLGFKTWVANNDRSIIYNGKRLGELDGVLQNLQQEGTLLHPYTKAANAALLIDCVWFKNGRLMPAVMEIEHTTGVTSGLSRMKNFQDALNAVLPPFPTRYVVVAPDEDRKKVVAEANKPQFHSLNARYFPYSAVEELYGIFQRRKIRGVTEELLDSFMEPICVNTENNPSINTSIQ